MYQLRYWNLLKELKTQVLYLHTYASSSEEHDKNLNIILAVSSSSSIAAWAVWQSYPMVWGAIIAISQVITAVKPFLPYRQRIKAISALNENLQQISLECERYWFEVSEGLITEKEIHDLCIKLKEKASDAERKHLSGVILPRKAKFLQQAEIEADIYLTNNYHGN